MKQTRKWRTPVMVGALGAFLVLVLVVAMILPKASQIRKRQGDLTKAKATQAQLTVQLAELRDAQKRAPANRAKLAKLQTQVPELADLASIIRAINTAADKSAVDFVSISPSAGTTGTGSKVSAVTTNLNVVGSYFAVDEFLYRLETLPRVSRVTNINISPQSEETNDLTATLTLLFWTTDLSIGPGSDPGHTDAEALAPATTVSPTPGASPSNGG